MVLSAQSLPKDRCSVIDLHTTNVYDGFLIPVAEGVAYVPELKKAYTSNAGRQHHCVVDLRRADEGHQENLHTEAQNAGRQRHDCVFTSVRCDNGARAEASWMCRTDNNREDAGIATVGERGNPNYTDPIAPEVLGVTSRQDIVFATSIRPGEVVVARYPVGVRRESRRL